MQPALLHCSITHPLQNQFATISFLPLESSHQDGWLAKNRTCLFSGLFNCFWSRSWIISKTEKSFFAFFSCHISQWVNNNYYPNSTAKIIWTSFQAMYRKILWVCRSIGNLLFQVRMYQQRRKCWWELRCRIWSLLYIHVCILAVRQCPMSFSSDPFKNWVWRGWDVNHRVSDCQGLVQPVN